MAQPIWNTPAGSIGSYPAELPFIFQFSASPVLPAISVTYQLLSGSLPTGITLTSAGLLSGTPGIVTQNTDSEFTVRVTDDLAGQVTTVAGAAYYGDYINFSLAINPMAEGTGVLKTAFYNNLLGGWHTTSGFIPTQNVWYQAVATYDGTTLNQYSNGSLQSTNNSSLGSSTTDGGGIRIAARWDTLAGSVNYFPGDIAIVKIYDGDIGSSGVTTNWNTNKARFEGL